MMMIIIIIVIFIFILRTLCKNNQMHITRRTYLLQSLWNQRRKLHFILLAVICTKNFNIFYQEIIKVRE